MPKGERLQFFESFGSLPKEIEKKEEIHFFFWFIINLFSLVSCWQRSLLPCTQMGTACRKWYCFEKKNELSKTVSGDSKFVLVYEKWPFKAILFRYYEMSIVKSIPMLNGLNKAIAFAQMWKNEIFVSCMLFLKEIKKKEQNQTFSLIIKPFNPASYYQCSCDL